MAGNVIVIRALDDILKRYGNQLASLGHKQAVKVMARALNYEGRKAFTLIKRAIVTQSSIPYGIVNAGTKFKSASTAMSSNLTASIIGEGGYLDLTPFKPRPIKSGVSATVWAKRYKYGRAFFRGGVPWHSVGKARLPIKPIYGAKVPDELARNNARDIPPKIFLAAQPLIVSRVEKEIEAVLRGY